MSQSQSHPIIIVKHVIIWQPSQLDIYIQLLHNHNNAQDYSLVEGSLKDKKFLLTRTFEMEYFHSFYLISFSISKFWWELEGLSTISLLQLFTIEPGNCGEKFYVNFPSIQLPHLLPSSSLICHWPGLVTVMNTIYKADMSISLMSTGKLRRTIGIATHWADIQTTQHKIVNTIDSKLNLNWG